MSLDSLNCDGSYIAYIVQDSDLVLVHDLVTGAYLVEG